MSTELWYLAASCRYSSRSRWRDSERLSSRRAQGQSEVDPLWWTPDHCAEEVSSSGAKCRT